MRRVAEPDHHGDESQSLTITVEDNFGNAFEWEVEFNNDTDEDVAVSDTLNVSR